MHKKPSEKKIKFLCKKICGKKKKFFRWIPDLHFSDRTLLNSIILSVISLFSLKPKSQIQHKIFLWHSTLIFYKSISLLKIFYVVLSWHEDCCFGFAFLRFGIPISLFLGSWIIIDNHIAVYCIRNDIQVFFHSLWSITENTHNNHIFSFS